MYCTKNNLKCFEEGNDNLTEQTFKCGTRKMNDGGRGIAIGKQRERELLCHNFKNKINIEI